MKIFGLVGWSGSGKTTLLIRLLPVLISRGLTVSTMKHGHHRFDVDSPGKDSYRHRDAGATEVLVASSRRWALMHELRDSPEPSMENLVRHMTPVDLLLVEGYKAAGHDKLEVHREAVNEDPIFPGDSTIVAVASDRPNLNAQIPWFDLDDPDAIAGFILAHCKLLTSVEQEVLDATGG
jgi:molybdopterin-guanine dinucleotide biosynthesis protein B